MTTSTASFAAVLITLLVAHHVADHWLQTGHQAVTKAAAGWPGRLADGRHVLAHTAFLAAVLMVVAWRLDLTLDPGRVALALTLNAITHWWADRVHTLNRFAHLVGKGAFVDLGDGYTAPTGTGRYALDQSWHQFWLLVAALIIVPS